MASGSSRHERPLEHSTPWAARLETVGSLVGIVTLALLLLVDLALEPSTVGASGGAVLVVLFVIATRRHQATTLAAGLAVGVSLLISAAEWATTPPVGSPGLAEAMALILLAGLAAARSTPRWAVTVGILSAGSIMVSNAVAGDAVFALGFTLLCWTALAGSIAAGLYLRTQSAARTRGIVDARNAERLEIARELHDTVAHHVTGMIVQAQAAQFVIDTDPQRARELMADVEKAGSAVMNATRHVVRDLRRTTPEPPSTSFDTELEQLVDHARTTGLTLAVDVTTPPLPLQTTVLRLTREALANIRRHAPTATTAHITATRTRSELVLTISNNGTRPTGSETTTGFGLIGMRERVESLGGHFSAGHTPSGWTVEAHLPLHP